MNFSAQLQFQLSYKVHPLQKPEKKALIFVQVCLFFVSHQAGFSCYSFLLYLYVNT